MVMISNSRGAHALRVELVHLYDWKIAAKLAELRSAQTEKGRIVFRTQAITLINLRDELIFLYVQGKAFNANRDDKKLTEAQREQWFNHVGMRYTVQHVMLMRK